MQLFSPLRLAPSRYGLLSRAGARTVLSACLLVPIFLPLVGSGPLLAEEFLFLDDAGIQQSEGLKRVLENPAKREAPVLTAQHPWEQNPYLFGNVVYDAKTKTFRMWYMSYNRKKPLAIRTPILYATSKDGITWHRPDLGLFDFEGSKANNALFGSLGFHDLYSPSVLEDPEAKDPNRRFKMIFWDKTGKDTYQHGGMHVAFSPDGIRWTRYEGNPVLRAGRNDRSISDVMDVMRDPKTGKFVVYAKGWNSEAWNSEGKENKEKSQRIIVRSESKDFIHWSKPLPVIRHARTPADPQSYGMPVFFHRGYYLGLLRSYHLPGDDRIDIRLMASRDGKRWTDVGEGTPFLPVGKAGAWDDGMVFTMPPIEHDGKLWIYYGGWDGSHEDAKRRSAVGLATLDAGRLAALTPQESGGSVITRPHAVRKGDVLDLNVDAGDGQVRLAVLDGKGKEIAGFELENSRISSTDSPAARVTWNGADFSSLAGRKVQLQIALEAPAKLFGFRIGAPSRTVNAGATKGRGVIP